MSNSIKHATITGATFFRDNLWQFCIRDFYSLSNLKEKIHQAYEKKKTVYIMANSRGLTGVINHPLLLKQLNKLYPSQQLKPFCVWYFLVWIKFECLHENICVWCNVSLCVKFIVYYELSLILKMARTIKANSSYFV